MDREQERRVLDANEAFYRSFRQADLKAMEQLWSTSHMVACMHPGWPVLHGYASVIASFRAIMESGSPPITPSDARAVLLGNAAFVTCIESIGEGRLIATNILAHQEGSWKMVHHQAASFRDRDVDDLTAPPAHLN